MYNRTRWVTLIIHVQIMQRKGEEKSMKHTNKYCQMSVIKGKTTPSSGSFTMFRKIKQHHQNEHSSKYNIFDHKAVAIDPTYLPVSHGEFQPLVLLRFTVVFNSTGKL